ncbi:MAG: competence/damage-inducible protein A [Gammaproteobacteria bacterium]|nr:competence/damage-inducible protein A [Gammaproteobacteria bacterium]
MQSIHLIIIGDEILSGRRADKHFEFARDLLAERHLSLASVRYVGDDTTELVQTLKESFARTHAITFVLGGIGATPDDKTRQAAAVALDLPLVRHAQGVAEIEAQFGSDAYPIRVRMADFPQGSSLIPNPVNRVSGFSIREHYFMPGFPQMSWPMMRWVLDTHYADLMGVPQQVYRILIQGQSESLWVHWMEQFEQRFPQLKIYSLPHLGEDGSRHIELGCVGEVAWVQAGFAELLAEAERREVTFSIVSG